MPRIPKANKRWNKEDSPLIELSKQVTGWNTPNYWERIEGKCFTAYALRMEFHTLWTENLTPLPTWLRLLHKDKDGDHAVSLKKTAQGETPKNWIIILSYTTLKYAGSW